MSKSLAESSIREGDIEKALVHLQSSVREDPSDASLRVFLFQLLAVKGDWDRALTQLNVAADMNEDNLLMAQAYRELLHCESYRAAVFEGTREPLTMGEPPAWLAKLVKALPVAAMGKGQTALEIAEDAFGQADARSGTLDGAAFQWICDADMRLGPVVEAFINGKYYWIPADNIAQIDISEPDDLRDLVWIPVEFTLTNGGKSIGFLPSRYPGEQTLSDPEAALARKTAWLDLGSEFFIGSGQKMFATNTGDYSILQIRQIKFDTVDRLTDGG